jgi:predicted GNAT superfamily acetyltransferase
MLKVPALPLVLRGRRFLLKVEDSASGADYTKFERLRNDVWGVPEDTLAGPRNMACENFLHEGSSLFLAAYAEDAAGGLAADAAHLVGFSYGFVGLKDKGLGYRSSENLWFYSQYTAVLPDYWGCGLGVPLKEFQRDVLMETLGIFTVVCTYDPLSAVNAYRNVHRFGMDVVEYRPATYGEFGGRLNRTDVPTDRFFMSWDLRRPVRHAALPLDDLLAAGAGLVDAEEETVPGRSGPVELEKIRSTRPDGGRDVVLVRIPRDFYAMLGETDVDDPDVRRIPIEWRARTRTVFQDLSARGYRVVDFGLAGSPRPSSFYILRRDL